MYFSMYYKKIGGNISLSAVLKINKTKSNDNHFSYMNISELPNFI
jgi:hypothetical protein